MKPTRFRELRFGRRKGKGLPACKVCGKALVPRLAAEHVACLAACKAAGVTRRGPGRDGG